MSKIKYKNIAKKIVADKYPANQVVLNPQLTSYLKQCDQRCRAAGSSLHSPEAINLAIEIWKDRNKASQTHEFKQN